ncbi:tRNA (adenosine(37)-N6)-dimethylallyltransferase MiaA [Ectobacillus sp. sgz5001026]|uniref:tRNA (adenosine(37)-N6)-dimethylallyltransferase MiaA n=1 Tax=Ectobacillus sp. sgz5001026 TaxID=3242473 RepID=UPI0036D38DB2
MGDLVKDKIVVVIGPTAVGKTKLSIDLAKALNGEIISGDSMQIYRKMNIGTAKVTKEEMDDIPHYMIDIKEPEEPFSVAEFQLHVRQHIQDIISRGKLPIIVGGTGLYIQSVLYDYQFTAISGDEAYRQELELFSQRAGATALYEKLVEVDPERAAHIHPNNIRRVIRALEIHHTSGTKMSEVLEEQENRMVYDAVLVGLTMERGQLYERINKRVDLMMEHGLLEEVRSLYDAGIRDCQSIQAIGYKELYQYVDGLISQDEAVQMLKTNSRRYAKRQLTWFRNKMDVAWFDVSNGTKMKEILKYVEGKLLF